MMSRVSLWVHNAEKMFFSSLVFLGILFLICGVQNAQAASAKKDVRLTVVFSAGDTLDILTRVLAQEVTADEEGKFNIIVENKPGAGGMSGVNAVLKGSADGTNIGSAVSNAFLLVPQKTQAPYKPLADSTPILIFGQAAPILVVKPDSPYNNFAELKTAALNTPNSISIALSGMGIPSHLSLEVAAKKEGIAWKYLPFAGAGEVETAILGGHADAGTTAALGRIKEGQFKPLAVMASKRLLSMADVPTFKELGYSDAGLNDTYFVLFAPSGISQDNLTELETAFSKATASKAFQDALKKFSVAPIVYAAEQAKEIFVKAWDAETEMLQSLDIIKEPATQAH